MDDRTYRYSSKEPLFPFGFGLSFTQFEYGSLILENAAVQSGHPLRATVMVSNRGGRAGEEVVQVYLSDLQASSTVPLHKLVDFRRVSLEAGQSIELSFELPAEALAFVGEDGREHLEAGEFRLEIGGCSPGKRGLALGAPVPATAVFQAR
jgi:beta-glucosidase